MVRMVRMVRMMGVRPMRVTGMRVARLPFGGTNRSVRVVRVRPVAVRAVAVRVVAVLTRVVAVARAVAVAAQPPSRARDHIRRVSYEAPACETKRTYEQNIQKQ